MPDAPRCPCGAPAELTINHLPVCRACYEDALRQEGSIMPALPEGEAVVVRQGTRVWRRWWWPTRGPPDET